MPKNKNVSYCNIRAIYNALRFLRHFKNPPPVIDLFPYILSLLILMHKFCNLWFLSKSDFDFFELVLLYLKVLVFLCWNFFTNCTDNFPNCWMIVSCCEVQQNWIVQICLDKQVLQESTTQNYKEFKILPVKCLYKQFAILFSSIKFCNKKETKRT